MRPALKPVQAISIGSDLARLHEPAADAAPSCDRELTRTALLQGPAFALAMRGAIEDESPKSFRGAGAHGPWTDWKGRACDRIEPRHRPRHRAHAGARGLRSHADRTRCGGAAGGGVGHRKMRARRKISRSRPARGKGGRGACRGRPGPVRPPRHPGQQCRRHKRGDFLALTDADWADGYALKFFAHVRLSRAAWPLLREARGSLITIGGTSGRIPIAAFTIGSSVNAACAAFAKALADLG